MACGVLSGNRNFEGRINPHTAANYLASPLLCIAYAIAGTVLIDFEKEPLGKRERGEQPLNHSSLFSKVRILPDSLCFCVTFGL